MLDPGTGKELWQGQGRGGDNAVLAMAGDLLFVVSTDATLRVMKWQNGSLDEVKRYEVASNAVWAEPGWLKDGLLVKDVRYLTRLALRAVAPPKNRRRSELRGLRPGKPLLRFSKVPLARPLTVPPGRCMG